MVLNRTDAGWQVSRAFDFMGCYFSGGETDQSRITAEYFDQDPERARVSGHHLPAAPRPGFRERFSLYMLLDRLIIWEYVHRRDIEVASKLGTLRRLDRTIYKDRGYARNSRLTTEIVPN